MSKVAYFLITFIGAIPAGGTLYLLIMNFLDRSEKLTGILLGVTIIASVCCTLVALTPFMVLVFYKDTRPKSSPSKKGADAGAAGADDDDGDDKEEGGFGDVIPDDYDADELAASVDDGDEYDDDDAFDDDGFDDDDDFDIEDDE